MKKWRVLDRVESNLFDHLKKTRSFDDEELTFEFDSQLHDPFLLPDMDKAVELVRSLDKKKDRIVVFGDYDADGTPATALLVKGLRRCGFSVEGKLPKREAGYGLKDEHILRFSKDYSLLITVDNGISSFDQVTRAKELGMKVIILDHHLPPAVLPPADAVVDPFRLDSKYPFPHLCGCALGYKFLIALSKKYPELSEGFLKWLLDLVAISTVTDMMMLRDENRTIVHYGLQVLAKSRNIGLSTLIQESGIELTSVSAGNIGWTIGPRLNTLGRLSDNQPVLDLLLTDDPIEANRLAKEINFSNATRQKQVADVLTSSREIIWNQNSKDDRIYIIIGENWPKGVVGLVAGRLSSEYNRPVLVATEKGDEIVGSARSIESYNIVEALESCSQALTRFGGHKQAAGFSLSVASKDLFIKLMKEHAHSVLTETDLTRLELVDAILRPDELNLETVNVIGRFAPFGHGNPEPKFVVPSARITSKKIMGKKQEHLRLDVDVNGTTLEVVGFGLAGEFSLNEAHLLVTLEENKWQGVSRLQAKLIDYLPVDSIFETVPAR